MARLFRQAVFRPAMSAYSNVVMLCRVKSAQYIAPFRASYSPFQSNRAKCPLFRPPSSSQLMPNRCRWLRTAFASARRALAGWRVLSMQERLVRIGDAGDALG